VQRQPLPRREWPRATRRHRRRPQALIVIAFVLSGLAPTALVPIAAAAPSTITLTSSSPTITWGESVTFTIHFGAAEPAQGVELLARGEQVTWTSIANLTTDAAGDASFVYRPATNLAYIAVFAGTSTLTPSISTVVPVAVRQLIALRPTSGGAVRTIARGSTVTFVTTVRPARADLPAATVRYRFYHRANGVWLRVATRNVVAVAGRASRRWTFSLSGDWYVRSMALATASNAASTLSQVERYRVR
jgi:hypothetical protein